MLPPETIRMLTGRGYSLPCPARSFFLF